jgi:hypothetical protein
MSTNAPSATSSLRRLNCSSNMSDRTWPRPASVTNLGALSRQRGRNRWKSIIVLSIPVGTIILFGQFWIQKTQHFLYSDSRPFKCLATGQMFKHKIGAIRSEQRRFKDKKRPYKCHGPFFSPSGFFFFEWAIYVTKDFSKMRPFQHFLFFSSVLLQILEERGPSGVPRSTHSRGLPAVHVWEVSLHAPSPAWNGRAQRCSRASLNIAAALQQKQHPNEWFFVIDWDWFDDYVVFFVC